VRAATRVNAEQASHGEAWVKGRVQSRMSRTPAGVAVSKVRARLHNLVVSAPDQPHIRSPFATAAPTSRLRRAGLRKTRTFLENGVSRPRPASVRPPGSVRTDYVLRITVLGTWKTGLSSGRPNHGAFDHDPSAHIFPERDQQLSRQRHDRRLATTTAVAFDPVLEPKGERRPRLMA
jgi:hypothetical protein